MIKITIIADSDIEDVSSFTIHRVVRALGVNVQRTGIKRITQKQFDKAMDQ
jgi:hypothetical protein